MRKGVKKYSYIQVYFLQGDSHLFVFVFLLFFWVDYNDLSIAMYVRQIRVK